MSSESISFEFSQKLVGLQKPLYAFILSLVHNRSDAEDVLQETNLILCKKSEEYESSGNFQAWAFRIARFQVMAHLTRRRRSKICFSNELVDTLVEEDFDVRKFQLMQKALQICFQKLPKHLKEIARLRFKEESPVKIISETLNRPVGSISASLFRIRENLAKCVRLKTIQIEAESEF